MSHYDVIYDTKNKSREELDAKAIDDIKEYLGRDKDGAERFQILLDCANEVNQGKMTVQQLNFTFGFAGIQGRPFHAFCRKYLLEKYKEWLRSPSGGEPVEPDEQGFWEHN